MLCLSCRIQGSSNNGLDSLLRKAAETDVLEPLAGNTFVERSCVGLLGGIVLDRRRLGMLRGEAVEFHLDACPQSLVGSKLGLV